VYPPVDLLQWVADCMKQFLDSEGKKNLNTVFGFEKSGKGRNRTNAFDKVEAIKADAHRLLQMAALIASFDLSVPDAAAFMARTAKIESAQTYERKWYSEWNKLLKDHDQLRSIYETVILKRSGWMSVEMKASFVCWISTGHTAKR